MDITSQSPDSFDMAIIGAGVVGCAIARRFTLEGAKTVVLEKALDVLDGASKGNSAILHTGFDAPPNSLEHSCINARIAFKGFMGRPCSRKINGNTTS